MLKNPKQVYVDMIYQVKLDNRRYNSTRPISRLPDETLIHIFNLYASDDAVVSSNGLPGLLAVTWVCTRWREVALHCPMLWRKPDFRFPSLAREMIHRSKSVPLDINLRFHHPQARRGWQQFEMLRIAMSYTARIRSLVLDFKAFSEPEAKRLITHIASPAPILRTLVLNCKRTVRVPDSFLGGETPRLRELTVCGASFNWSAPFLENLTCLKLLEQAAFCRQAYAFDFVAALRRMPALEFLELDHTLFVPPKAKDGREIERDQVHMAHLRELHLTSVLVPCCTSVLECLLFPATTILKITCRLDVNGTTPEECRLMSTRISHIYAESGHIFRYLTLRKINHLSLICASPTNSHSPDSPGSLIIRLIQRQRDLLHQLDVFRRCLDPLASVFEDIQTLETTFDDVFGPLDLARRFGHLPMLNTIHIRNLNPHDMLCALVHGLHELPPLLSYALPEETEATCSSCAVPFQGLDTLVLENIDFEDTSILVDILLLRLHQRQIHSVSIKSLVLLNCTELTKRGVEELRRTGIHVQWDGIVSSNTPPTVGSSTRLWASLKL
ncbi:hypothetical protein PM082_003694 [Marasmius tenuissimus]|nr:hypothetical protein PM082_003694 [Marasmius tenuissimus]